MPAPSATLRPDVSTGPWVLRVEDPRPAAGSAGAPSEGLGPTLVRAAGGELGAQATLVQFSSAFCAPCRATRQVLARVSDLVPGVHHCEIDAEEHLDLVRAAGVTRTPTTLILGATGEEVCRAAGAPTKDQVLGALASAVGEPGQQACR